MFFFSSRRRHTRCALVTGVQTCALPIYLKEGIPMATLLGADITPEEKQQLAPVGYSIEGEHSATCVLVDQDVRHIAVNDPDVEILPLKDALTRYDWEIGRAHV